MSFREINLKEWLEVEFRIIVDTNVGRVKTMANISAGRTGITEVERGPVCKGRPFPEKKQYIRTILFAFYQLLIQYFYFYTNDLHTKSQDVC